MSVEIPISEIFGPTIQGEGFHAGVPTVFVRTGGCDYRCQWCDTLYAVLPEFKKDWIKHTPEQIMEKVEELSKEPILITFSGGNPALHDLKPVIDLAHSKGYTTTMETQGSVPQMWFNDLTHLIISPKPPSSQMKTDWLKLNDCINSVQDPNKISLKVVVNDISDYNYALEVFDRYPFIKNRFITPCNTSPGDPDFDAIYEKARFVVDTVLKDKRYDITILPQLHVLLYGNERGK